MTIDLNTAKLAELASTLSGKENALLIIGYLEKERVGENKFATEVHTIRSVIRSSDLNKQREFWFYYQMWEAVEFYSLDLQTAILSLQNVTERFGILNQAIHGDNVRLTLSRGLNMLPQIMTKVSFEEAYKKHRAEYLAEVYPIEAIADHEAFAKLQDEGLADKSLCLEEYLQQVVGNEVSVTEKQFMEKSDEAANWIRSLIKQGQLTTASVEKEISWYHAGKDWAGQMGVVAESWYKLSDKHEKTLNRVIDNKEELVDMEEGMFAVEVFRSFSNEENKDSFGDSMRKHILDLLTRTVYVQKDDEGLVFVPNIKSYVSRLVEQSNEYIQSIQDYTAVINRVQAVVYEDSLELSSRLISRGREACNDAASPLKEIYRETEDTYNFYREKIEIKFKCDCLFEINTSPEPNKEEVEKQFIALIGYAERDSGYKYHL